MQFEEQQETNKQDKATFNWRERKKEHLLYLFFILQIAVLGSGLIFFQPVLLACRYHNDTIITVTKSTLQILHQSSHTKKLTVQANIIDMALKLGTLNVTK